MKKLLALVLALVMTLSLCTVTNAAYPDAADIDYKEAVEVMSALKILQGDEKGNFNPDDTLTREAAAKIICYMLLGSTTADKLTVETAPFSDVAANRWSAPFVAYCAANHIVDGRGDGTFDPAGTLTGHAFGKMLLTALKIDGEFTGSNWAINVATALVDNGLDESVESVILSGNLTREQAAQMAFNALFFSATTEKKDVYTITVTTDTDDSMAAVADTNYDSFTEAYLLAKEADSGSDVWNITKATAEVKEDSLADDVFKAAKVTKADEFMRPASYYTSTAKAYKDMDVAVVDDAEYVIEGAIKDKDLYSEVGYKAAKDYTWANYVDGLTATNAAAKPSKTGTSSFQNTANGTVAYVYIDDDAKTVTFCVVNEFIGEVKKVTDAKEGDKRFVTLTNGKTFETEDFAAKDVVIYTESNKVTTAPETEGIQSMELAQVVSGKLTKFTTGTSTVWTIDGNDYKLAKNGTTAIDGGKLNKDVSVYVDAQGFIMKDKSAAETTKEYVLVLANGADEASKTYQTGVTTTLEVYGVNGEGETVTYTVSKIGGSAVTTTAVNALQNKLYTYETDSDGNYELTEVDAQVAANIELRATQLTYGTSSAKAIVNSTTQFVFVEQKDVAIGNLTVKSVTVKSGNAAIGNTIAADKAKAAVEDGVAKYVFVTSEFVDESTDSGEVVYVDASSKTTSTVKEDGKTTTTYTYDAYGVDGKVSVTSTTVDISSDALYKLNDDNTITTPVSGTASGVITAIDGNVVTIKPAGPAVSLNLVDDTDDIYTDEDAALAVGQAVVYKTNSTKTTNLDAIVVTADQETVAFTLGSVTTGYTATTTAYELIVGSDVVNTVKVTLTGDFTGATSVTLAGAAVHSLAPAEKINDTITLSFDYTTTSATAITANVTVA